MLRKVAKQEIKDNAEAAKTDTGVAARNASLQKVADLCRDMGGLIECRNHLMHGLWAIHWPDDGETEAASHFAKNPKPIMATKVAALTDQAATFSSELGLAWRALTPHDFLAQAPLPRPFYFGDGDPAKKKDPKPLPRSP
jgi:hypothetical protein